MEKKQYLKPESRVQTLEPVELVAASPEVSSKSAYGSDQGSAGTCLSNERRGQWGDLWTDE